MDMEATRVIETFEVYAYELLSRGAILRRESHALAEQRDALLPGGGMSTPSSLRME